MAVVSADSVGPRLRAAEFSGWLRTVKGGCLQHALENSETLPGPFLIHLRICRRKEQSRRMRAVDRLMHCFLKEPASFGALLGQLRDLFPVIRVEHSV